MNDASVHALSCTYIYVPKSAETQTMLVKRVIFAATMRVESRGRSTGGGGEGSQQRDFTPRNNDRDSLGVGGVLIDLLR